MQKAEEQRRQRTLELEKQRVKQEIIVKVLTETADMEALRSARRYAPTVEYNRLIA